MLHLQRHPTSVLTAEATINTLKPSGNYIYHMLHQSVALHFVFTGFLLFSL
jgi:hypothetical protein